MPFPRSARMMHLLVPAAGLGLLTVILASAGVSSASVARSPERTAGARPHLLPRVCSSIADPYRTQDSVLRQCGYQLIPLQAVRTLPGGGKAYVYRVDGTREENIVPPRGFNPLTASARQLSEYGIPSVKQVGSRSEWVKIMRAARYTAPPRLLIAGGPVNPGATSGSQAQPWAGYVATDNSDYDFVSTKYTEPYIGSSICTDVAVGSWVGIGGYGSSPYLAQAGTSFGVASQPNLHNEFQELVISSTEYAPVWYGEVSYGDPIYAKVTWDSSTDKYNYYVSDSSNGNTLDVTAPSSHYDGTSAEVITEAPVGYNLANFGKITFTNAQVGATGSDPIALGSWEPAQLIMTDVGGNTMAYPDAIYGSGEDFSNNDRSCD
jgi:hypothetical protein